MGASKNGGSTGNSHGRRNSGAAPSQWQVGDVVTDGSACPASANTVTVTSNNHAFGARYVGQYFNFDKPTGWTSGTATNVKQCRNGQQIWSGARAIRKEGGILELPPISGK